MGLPRRCRELRHDARNRYSRTAARQLVLLEHLTRPIVLVPDDIRGREALAYRHCGALQRVDDIRDVVLRGPRTDRPIELLITGDASVVMGECRVVGQISTLDRGHETLEERVSIGGDDHVVTVAAEIRV